jgi:Mce-associated membrane protein
MADDAAAPSGELSKPAVEPVEPVEPEANLEESDEDYDAAPDEDGDDGDADGESGEDAETDVESGAVTARISHVGLATIVGLVVVVALGGLVGWLGFRAYHSHQADVQRNVFLQVGRQGALNLTTIDYQHVDQDVQRILDSATGTFYDDFQQRSQPFTEVVKQVKSKSVGSVTEAGLESATANDAQVLVAVAVTTTIEGQPQQQPRAWRMRILVQKVGNDTKVSNVEFVP